MSKNEELVTELELFMWGWYDRVSGPGESWTFADMAAAIVESDWLSAYTTRIREEALAGEWEYKYAEVFKDETYYYGESGHRPFETFEAANAARIEESDIVVRRRKAGPWEPVPGGDSNAQ